MKSLLLILSAIAIATTGFAQSGAQIDVAIAKLLYGTGRAPNSISGTPNAAVASGVIGLNNRLALSADGSGNLLIHNTENGYTHKIVFPAPTANRTTTFPIGGGTVSTSPSTLTYQFTGADHDVVLTQVEPTVGDTVVTFPDTANVDVSVPLSTLTTNSLTAANSIFLESNGIVAEGATANASEIRLTFADATADVLYTFPDAAAATYGVVTSTLAANGAEAATAVWGVANGLKGEGTTADTSEGTISFGEPTADRTYTMPDASGTVKVFISEDVTATNEIAATENGTVFYLNSATEFVSTLPAPAVGLEFTFIVAAAPSGANYTIVANGSGAGNDVIKGQAHITADAAGDVGTADDTISFVSAQAVAGDMVKVWSDGTSWFAHAYAAVAAGVTFTDAD